MPKLPEYITPKEAGKIIAESWHGPISYVTMYNWLRKYKLGFKFASRWRVDKAKLIRFLKEGETNGRRT